MISYFNSLLSRRQVKLTPCFGSECFKLPAAVIRDEFFNLWNQKSFQNTRTVLSFVVMALYNPDLTRVNTAVK